ncbi:MAG TPA: hypothetical protein VM223_18180 [Planctomycetota bacterium]|nr:hypothetical protein [Planctomycetota bacterium]
MPNDELRDQLKGVQLDPPPAIEDDLTNDEVIEDDADPAEDTGGDDDKKTDEDRPPTNWYREMARKQEAFQEKMQREFLEAQERMMENFRSTPVKPPENNGDPLAQRTIAELKQLRADVPEGQKQAYEEYLVERIAQDVAQKSIDEFKSAYTAVSSREQAVKDAVNRFPDLANPASDFAKAANAKLQKLGKGYIDSNPRAVLDVANEVALETGTSFRGPNPARRTNPPGKPASGNQSPATSQPDGKEDKARKARLKAIGKKLERANGGKPFDMARIEATNKAHRENIDIFLRK